MASASKRSCAGSCPDFVPGWTLGTTSFRSIEEQGRKLKPRSSNELVHIDAGAYGATNGARILRFFVNIHPTATASGARRAASARSCAGIRELVGAAKGGKPTRRDRQRAARQALQRPRRRRRQALPAVPRHRLEPVRPFDAPHPQLHEGEPRVPRQSCEGYQEIHFPPLSSWMVFTDGISHSVLTGQHALVTTVLIPLANCPHPGARRRISVLAAPQREPRAMAQLHFTQNLTRHTECPSARRCRPTPSPSCSSATSSRWPGRARLRARRSGRGAPPRQGARRRPQPARPPQAHGSH